MVPVAMKRWNSDDGASPGAGLIAGVGAYLAAFSLAAGLPLPAHGHTGVEYMQILSGTLNDERGQFLAGDLDEAGEEIDHRPVVDASSDCVCLAALDGDIRLHSLLGRLVRPLVGF